MNQSFCEIQRVADLLHGLEIKSPGRRSEYGEIVWCNNFEGKLLEAMESIFIREYVPDRFRKDRCNYKLQSFDAGWGSDVQGIVENTAYMAGADDWNRVCPGNGTEFYDLDEFWYRATSFTAEGFKYEFESVAEYVFDILSYKREDELLEIFQSLDFPESDRDTLPSDCFDLNRNQIYGAFYLMHLLWRSLPKEIMDVVAKKCTNIHDYNYVVCELADEVIPLMLGSGSDSDEVLHPTTLERSILRFSVYSFLNTYLPQIISWESQKVADYLLRIRKVISDEERAVMDFLFERMTGSRADYVAIKTEGEVTYGEEDRGEMFFCGIQDGSFYFVLTCPISDAIQPVVRLSSAVFNRAYELLDEQCKTAAIA